MDDKERRRIRAKARRDAKRVLREVVCVTCQKKFPSAHSRAKYCSDPCYTKGQKPLHTASRRKRDGLNPEGDLSRRCIVCTAEFPRANPNQKRCLSCIENPGTHAPLCGCGCGEKTSWQPTIGYAEFMPSHNLRKAGFGVTRYIDRACITCGRIFPARNEEHKNCSRICYAKSRSGQNHERFKGGRTKYTALFDPYKLRYIRSHRVIMQQVIGRELKWHEVVHHIDEDGTNQKLENLHLFHCERCHHHHHGNGAPLVYRYKEAHIKNGVTVGLPKRKPNQIGK